MTNKPNACYNQGNRLWLNLHSAAFKLSANPIEVMRQKYSKASFSKDERSSNWESLMFLIFRWLGIRLLRVPTLSFPNYCHLLLQHEDHISENLVFEMWWGSFCSLVHSAIMHRVAVNLPATCFSYACKICGFHIISVRPWRNSTKRMKGRSYFHLFSSLLGRKEKKNHSNWNLPSEFWGSWTTVVLFPLCDSTSLTVLSSSFTGVLTANGRGQEPSQVNYFSHEMHHYTSELETRRPFWWPLTVLCDCKSKHCDSH